MLFMLRKWVILLFIPFLFTSFALGCEEYTVRVSDCSKYETCSCGIKKVGDTCYRELYNVNNYECNCRIVQKEVQDCYEEAYCIREESYTCCRSISYPKTCRDVYTCGRVCNTYKTCFDCYKQDRYGNMKYVTNGCCYTYELCYDNLCVNEYICSENVQECSTCSGCAEMGKRQICSSRTVEETVCDTCSENVFLNLESFPCEKQGIVCLSNIKVCEKENEFTDFSVFNPIPGEGFESDEEIPVGEETKEGVSGGVLLFALPFIALILVQNFLKDEEAVNQAKEDFKNGFLKGSYGSSDIFKIIGDFFSGLLVYGDIRDLIYYISGKLGLTKEEYNDFFGALAALGILTNVPGLNVPDAALSALKTCLKNKKLSYLLKTTINILNKIPKEKFDNGFNLLTRYLKELPPDEINDALKSIAKIVNKLPNEDILKLAKSKAVIEFANQDTKFLTKSMDIFTNIEGEINLGIDLLKTKNAGKIASVVFEKQPDNVIAAFANNKIFIDPYKLKLTAKYEVVIHEFMHKAQFTESVLLNGEPVSLKIYNKFLKDNLGYITNEVRNSLLDVGCSKLALTHGSVDRAKFLEEFYLGEKKLIGDMQRFLREGISPNDLARSDLSNLAELKIIALKDDNLKLINQINELIESTKDSKIIKEFNKLTKVFEDFYNSLGWSN